MPVNFVLYPICTTFVLFNNLAVITMQISTSTPRRREPRYPIGIQNFEKLREGGYEYVDKTHHIRRLIDMGNPYYKPCDPESL